MPGPVAILDACVLYSAPLRDVMLSVATVGRLFQPRWTDHIREEYMRNLRANRPDLSQKKLDWTWQQMCTVPDCLVMGYEHRLSVLSLPDMTDCHVLAAAITADANVIVTYNTRDFPASELRPFGLKSVSPDTFLLSLS